MQEPEENEAEETNAEAKKSVNKLPEPEPKIVGGYFDQLGKRLREAWHPGRKGRPSR